MISRRRVGAGGSHRSAGFAAYKNRSFEAASEQFRLAVSVEPRNPAAWLGLARSERALGHLGSSRAAVLEALRLHSKWRPALWLLGSLAATAQDAAELEDVTRRLGSLERMDQPSIERVGRLCLTGRAWDLLERFSRTGLQSYPDSGELLHQHLVASLHLKGHDEAWKAARPYLGSDNSEHQLAAARFAIEVGLLKHADRFLSNVRGTNGELLFRLGVALYKRGFLTRAVSILERAVEADPELADAANLLAKTGGELRVLRENLPTAIRHGGDYVGHKGRVLHVVGKSLPFVQSGYTLRTHYLCRAQQASGMSVHVATQVDFPWREGHMTSDAEQRMDGVTYHRLRAELGANAPLDIRIEANAELLAKLVEQCQPSVLHAASDYINARLALAVGRACDIPVVYEVRGFWEETWLSKRGPDTTESDVYLLRKSSEVKCMRAADAVVTLGEAMKTEIVAAGIPAHKVTVVPNAVDVDAFGPVGKDPTLARRIGVHNGTPVVGYISSLVPYEGIEYLIEAVAMLKSRGVEAQCLIVGDGPDRGRLTSIARELDVMSDVIFTGRIPHHEILSFYGLIDIFVVPRTADRVCRFVIPLKPYEAMATGRVVVVSDVPALREIVRPNETGFSFGCEDAADLADVLDRLIKDPAARKRAAAGGREWVLEHRTWEQNGDRYRKLYSSLGVS